MKKFKTFNNITDNNEISFSIFDTFLKNITIILKNRKHQKFNKTRVKLK